MLNDCDKSKIENLIKDRKHAHAFFDNASPVYRAFLQLEEKAFEDGALSRGNKELIAIGISIITNCESCLEWHIKKALDAGITQNQIIEAIGVGIEMGGGPATVSSRFALKVLEHYSQ